MSKIWQVIVIGAGPAGASCAVWLRQLGFEPLLLEAAAQPGGLLCTHTYPDIWTLTNPNQTGKEMAELMLKQLDVAQVPLRCHTRVTSVQSADDGFEVHMQDSEGQMQQARAQFVVVASGVVARRTPGVDAQEDFEGVVFGPGDTVKHGDYKGLSVAVLGGGDNAFENFLYVQSHGAREVDLYARTVRAQQQFIDQVPPSAVHVGPVKCDLENRLVNGRRYDLILVFYGWEPATVFLEGLDLARDARGFLQVNPETTETSVPGLYAIGEVTQRMHPCVPTAMADGVVAAKAIEVRLGEAQRHDALPRKA